MKPCQPESLFWTALACTDKIGPALKKEFDNGTFDTKNVNTHQLESYHQIMKGKAKTLTPGSSQAEVFNVLGQLQTIERVKEEKGLLKHDEKKAIEQPTFGKSTS